MLTESSCFTLWFNRSWSVLLTFPLTGSIDCVTEKENSSNGFEVSLRESFLFFFSSFLFSSLSLMQLNESLRFSSLDNDLSNDVFFPSTERRLIDGSGEDGALIFAAGFFGLTSSSSSSFALALVIG